MPLGGAGDQFHFHSQELGCGLCGEVHAVSDTGGRPKDGDVAATEHFPVEQIQDLVIHAEEIRKEVDLVIREVVSFQVAEHHNPVGHAAVGNA